VERNLDKMYKGGEGGWEESGEKREGGRGVRRIIVGTSRYSEPTTQGDIYEAKRIKK